MERKGYKKEAMYRTVNVVICARAVHHIFSSSRNHKTLRPTYQVARGNTRIPRCPRKTSTGELRPKLRRGRKTTVVDKLGGLQGRFSGFHIILRCFGNTGPSMGHMTKGFRVTIMPY